MVLLIEVGEVGTDARDVRMGFLGVVGPEAGEDFQSTLPMPACLIVVVEGVVSVGKAVVGAGLICWLGQVGRVLQRLLMVGQREIGLACGMVQTADALEAFELPVAVAKFTGEAEDLLVPFHG